MWGRAFTLIELIVVAAIISILAAIAVPNFLQAQIRAKVSAMHSNLRIIDGALQAYAVDHHRVPPYTSFPWNSPPHAPVWMPDEKCKVWPGYAESSSGLTTPIAYLTSVQSLEDLFLQGYRYPKRLTYQVYYRTVDEYDEIYGDGEDEDSEEFTGCRCKAPKLNGASFMLLSTGPDRMFAAWPDGRFSFLGDGDFEPNFMPYDPSNGTISTGDLYRTDGWIDFYYEEPEEEEGEAVGDGEEEEDGGDGEEED